MPLVPVCRVTQVPSSQNCILIIIISNSICRFAVLTNYLEVEHFCVSALPPLGLDSFIHAIHPAPITLPLMVHCSEVSGDHCKAHVYPSLRVLVDANCFSHSNIRHCPAYRLTVLTMFPSSP